MPIHRLRHRLEPHRLPEPRIPRWLWRKLASPARLVQRMAVVPLPEITAAFAGREADYPPILSLKQAAALAHVHPGTLKRWVGQGRFKPSVRRGKPLLFWRDKFVAELLRG